MREASRMHRRVWVWRRADRSDFRLIISGCKSEANNPRSRFRARRLRPSARGRRRRSRSAFWASTAAACERATLFRAEVSRGGEEAGPSGASESSSPRTCDRLGAPNPRVGAAPATPDERRRPWRNSLGLDFPDQEKIGVARAGSAASPRSFGRSTLFFRQHTGRRAGPGC